MRGRLKYLTKTTFGYVTIFCVMTLCSDVRDQCFGGPCCLHLQGESLTYVWLHWIIDKILHRCL